MKLIRRGDQSHQLSSRPRSYPQLYFFYEKSTGVAHFHVQSGSQGEFPVEQAAGLLAMHCLVRGQSPDDYVVMVEADPRLLQGLAEKAEKLLEAGHAVNSAIKLTRREEEVLGGVMRSLANKEIAASLNLSERTVKFHVSSLLSKFRVRGRMELAREAVRHTATPVPQQATSREDRPYTPTPQGPLPALRRVGPIPVLAQRHVMA